MVTICLVRHSAKLEAMIANRLAQPERSDRKILIVQKRIGEP
jgi:hypothetical protein